MAGLPYMQFYVADYLSDTMHLTAEEHGAYLLLIFNYWQTGKRLKKDRLPIISRMNGRWPDVEAALAEFFEDDGESWIHHRIEDDLAQVLSDLEQKSKAGKASAAVRRAKRQRKANGNPTGVEQPLPSRTNDRTNGSATNILDKKRQDKEENTHTSACENFEGQFDGATNEILALWESCCAKANPPKTFLRDGKTIIGAGRLAESGATGEQIQKAMENLLADMDRRDTYTLEGLAANLGNWIDRKGWNSGNDTRRPGASTRGQGHRPEDYSTDFD